MEFIVLALSIGFTITCFFLGLETIIRSVNNNTEKGVEIIFGFSILAVSILWSTFFLILN